MSYSSADSACRRHFARLLTVGLACLCCWATLASASDYNLPALGEPSNTTLSLADEQRIGAQVFSQMLRAGHVVEDVELRHYLQQVGTRLVKATTHAPDEFRFFVVDSPVINAFALPGGFIGINAGLILKTKSESELASVIAHEVSHVTQRHIARQIAATKGTQWATLAALLGAAIVAGGDPDAVQAAITGSMSIIQQQQITYTRKHELEADRLGIRLLAKAHFDPNAMAGFFETMQRRARLYGNQLPQILLTHPVNNTRIAEARARAADYPAPTIVESPDYAVMKERVRALTSTQNSALLNHYQRLGAPDDTPAAQDYGYALALLHTSNAKRATSILQALVRDNPDQVHYTITLARAQDGSGNIKTALATLSHALNRFSSSPALKLEYATALIHDKQLDAARAFLQTHPELTGSYYEAQTLLARIAGTRGDLGEAYYRQALYRRMRGAYVPAIRELRSVLHESDLSQLDHNRLQALLDQIIVQCNAAWTSNGCTQRVLHQPVRN